MMKRKRVFSILQAAGIAVLLLFALPVDAKMEKPDTTTNSVIAKDPIIVVLEEPAEAIDLGLPSGTLWASYNIGATKPEEYGDYFAWGETTPKSVYNFSTYLYKREEYDHTYTDIGRNISGTNYDVAHIKWGGDWCMPTKEDFNELWTNCIHSWTMVNGVKGMLFTASNGKSIFLPAAGIKSDYSFSEANENGYFRAATSLTYYTNSIGCTDYFALEEPDFIDIFLTDGISVRPVIHPISVPESSFYVSCTEIDFDLVELGTDKMKSFKVFNTTDRNITFNVSCDEEMLRYFEITDNGKEFILAPNTSKEYIVTSHGMPTSHEASTTLHIISDFDNQKREIKLKSYGWDFLIETTEYTMTVGEKLTIPIKTDNFTMAINEYGQIVSVTKGGGENIGMNVASVYNSTVNSSSGKIEVEAVGTGKARQIVCDELSNKECYIEITVNDKTAFLKVEPTEIDFGVVESGTTKTKTFTVTNTGKSDLTFTVPNLDWRGYFVVSDTDTDFTLVPNTSKTISVTANGMIRGESAGCYIQVKATTGDGELTEKVQGHAEGWDNNPLTLASKSLKLSVGESSQVDITYGSLNYEVTNDNPTVADAHISSNGVSSGGRYSSHHWSEGKVFVEAKSVGKATLTIKDKNTTEETTLTITVTDGNSGGNEGWRKTIIVTTLDGTTMEYLIDEDTKIKVEKPYLVIETDNVVLNYELEKMKNLRYGKKFISDGIEDVIVENGQPFQYKDETLFFKDLPENSQVGIYTTDGKTVVSRQCSGEASLSLNSLPSGMYIVKINDESYKILKK